MAGPARQMQPETAIFGGGRCAVIWRIIAASPST
jgi:hypothetical protein